MHKGKKCSRNKDGSARFVGQLARDIATAIVPMTDAQMEAAAVSLVRSCGIPAETVDGFCRDVLGGYALADARRMVEALVMVAAGALWKDVLEKVGLGWSDVAEPSYTSKEYRLVFEMARQRQLKAQAARTQDALVDVAVNGEAVPIIVNGEVVAERRVRSVRAMERMLAAGDERFATEKGGGGIHANGPTFVFPVMPTLTAEDVRRAREETERVIDVKAEDAPKGVASQPGLLSGLEPEGVEEVEP